MAEEIGIGNSIILSKIGQGNKVRKFFCGSYFLSFQPIHLNDKTTCSTIFNPRNNLQKSTLSKKYSSQRKSIEMTTSLERQPLYCQNTFCKQFISVYKLIICNSKISRSTQALGHNPLHHPLPAEKGWRNAPIATLINKSCIV